MNILVFLPAVMLSFLFSQNAPAEPVELCGGTETFETLIAKADLEDGANAQTESSFRLKTFKEFPYTPGTFAATGFFGPETLKYYVFHCEGKGLKVVRSWQTQLKGMEFKPSFEFAPYWISEGRRAYGIRYSVSHYGMGGPCGSGYTTTTRIVLFDPASTADLPVFDYEFDSESYSGGETKTSRKKRNDQSEAFECETYRTSATPVLSVDSQHKHKGANDWLFKLQRTKTEKSEKWGSESKVLKSSTDKRTWRLLWDGQQYKPDEILLDKKTFEM